MKKHYVVEMFLNLSKTFDSLNIEIIIYKLETMSARGQFFFILFMVFDISIINVFLVL